MSDFFNIENSIYINNDTNVGIGITNPDKKLEVVGDIDTTTDYNINGTQVLSATTLGSGVVNSSLTSVGTLSSLDVTGNVDVDGTFDSQGAATFQTTATVNDDFFVGPGPLQSTNTFYVDKGSNLVNISGSFDVWDKFRVDSNATYVETGILCLGESLASGAVIDTGGSNIRLSPNVSNSGALEVDSNGNTNLAGDLSVSGSSEITGFLDVKSTSTTTPLLSLRSGNGDVAFNDGAQIQFGYGGNQQYNHFIHTRHNSSDLNNAIDFYLCDGTQSNTLTSGANHVMSLVSGNVGIGITDPAKPLHIYSTTKEIIRLEGGDGGACHIGFLNTDTTSEPSVTIGLVSSDDLKLNVVDAKDMFFSTTDTERMRIDASGNVGIGCTANSTELLELYKADDNAQMAITRGNGAQIKLKAQDNQSRLTYEGGDFRFDRDESGTNTMILDSSGNVGIGTTTPEGLLQVKVRPDTDYYASYKDMYLGSYLSIGYQRYGNLPYIGYNARLYTSIVNTSGDAYTSNGNQNGNFFKPPYAGTSASTMRIQGGSHDGTMWWKHYNHGTNSDQVNEGSFTTDMYMDKDGNLGLGLTNPACKLEVNGQVFSNNRIVHYREEQVNGTYGGTRTGTTFQTRTLNVRYGDTSFTTFSSNAITFTETGTYRISARCPGYRVNRHQCKLKQTDDANGGTANLIYGSSMFANNTAPANQNDSTFDSIFSITNGDVIKLQHYCQSSTGGHDYGVDSSSGGTEVFSEMWIERLN
jgi:hypothetical protein